MTNLFRIPFNKPTLVGNEFQYVAQAIQQGHISGDGLFTRQCHGLLEKILGVTKTLLTTSCTHALDMSAILVDVQPGDEVIVPAFTFPSTVNAFVLRGGYPVFADIRPDTLNLDEQQLEALITPRTKAIAVVHYAGVGCEMDKIMQIAARHGVAIIEDNAHGLFGKYRGQYLGTFGCMATQSFHETKNITCGEGGALLINDPQYIERAEIIREKGTDRSRFFRGQVDKYTWVDVGSSYLPSEILAAFLYAQLERWEEIQVKRRYIWERYRQQLGNWAVENGVQLPVIPVHCEQSYHMFYLLMSSPEHRGALIDYLNECGILSVFHYLPLHLSAMGRRFGGREGMCPITEDVSARLLRLPFHNQLGESDLDRIISCIAKFTEI